VAWSWDITLLPSGVKEIWFYVYMVMNVWSRKIIAWEIHERECPQVAGEMLQRATGVRGSAKRRR
jgi:transposase InsO family protein